MGTAGGRRGGVPVEDEQDGGGKSTTSRTGGVRVGDELGRAREEQDRRWRIDDELGTRRGRASELGRAGEKQRRSRGEAEEQDRRDEQERRPAGLRERGHPLAVAAGVVVQAAEEGGHGRPAENHEHVDGHRYPP